MSMHSSVAIFDCMAIREAISASINKVMLGKSSDHYNYIVYSK